MIWIWLGFVIYALFLAPGNGYASDPIIHEMLQGNFTKINPLVVTVFTFLGLFPLLFAVLLLPVDRDKIPAWPFILGSFALGAFSLLPYFFFKKGSNLSPLRTPRWINNMVSSKAFSLLLILLALSSLTYLGKGFSFDSYWGAFHDSKLVSVMTVDFFILTGLSSYTLLSIYDIKEKRWLSFIPIIGPLMLRWKK